MVKCAKIETLGLFNGPRHITRSKNFVLVFDWLKINKERGKYMYFDGMMKPTITEEVMLMKGLVPLLKSWSVMFPDETSADDGIREVGEFANFLEDDDNVGSIHTPSGGMSLYGNIFGSPEIAQGSLIKTTGEIAHIKREPWNLDRDEDPELSFIEPYEVSYLNEKKLYKATTKDNRVYYFFSNEMSPMAKIAFLQYGTRAKF